MERKPTADTKGEERNSDQANDISNSIRDDAVLVSRQSHPLCDQETTLHKCIYFVSCMFALADYKGKATN